MNGPRRRRSLDAGPGSCHCPEADGWTWWRGEEGERLVAPLIRGFDARSIARACVNSQVTIHRYDRRVRTGLGVLGLLVVLGGLVWIAQGLNLPFAPRSFMTADRTWVVIGALAILAGAVLIGRSRLFRR